MIRKETFEVISKKCAGCVDGDCYFSRDENVTCSVDGCPYLDYSEKQTVLNPQQFADLMLEIYTQEHLENDDQEVAHCEMDKAICELLIALGYEEAVYIFENTPKCYA